MLDLYVQKACEDQAKEAHVQNLTKAMMSLSFEELEKIACDGMSGLDRKDEWLKAYEGTPLFDKALQLAHQLLEIDMQSQQMNQQRDAQYDVERSSIKQLGAQRDLLRVQQRTMGLELAQFQQAQMTMPQLPQLPQAKPAQDMGKVASNQGSEFRHAIDAANAHGASIPQAAKGMWDRTKQLFSTSHLSNLGEHLTNPHVLPGGLEDTEIKHLKDLYGKHDMTGSKAYATEAAKVLGTYAVTGTALTGGVLGARHLLKSNQPAEEAHPPMLNKAAAARVFSLMSKQAGLAMPIAGAIGGGIVGYGSGAGKDDTVLGAAGRTAAGVLTGGSLALAGKTGLRAIKSYNPAQGRGAAYALGKGVNSTANEVSKAVGGGRMSPVDVNKLRITPTAPRPAATKAGRAVPASVEDGLFPNIPSNKTNKNSPLPQVPKAKPNVGRVVSPGVSTVPGPTSIAEVNAHKSPLPQTPQHPLMSLFN